MNRPKGRVAQITAPGTVSFFTREVPPPAPGEVVVKVRASAICGSDLHLFRGLHPAVALPSTIGHEFSGDVVETGEEVTRVRPGDRVTVEPAITCGTCQACLQGRYSHCERITFTYRVGQGSMSDYVTVDQNRVYHLPPHLDYHSAALLEPLAVATHAVRRAGLTLGDSVLILGAGAIGLMVCALAKYMGVRQILIADLQDSRLRLAETLGATKTIRPAAGEDLTAAIRRCTDGQGVTRSFECAGHEATLQAATGALGKDGLCTVVGLFETPSVSIPINQWVANEIRLQGSQGYCWDFPIALQVSREINLSSFITHRFPLEKLQEALETCLNPESQSIKVLVEP